MTPQRPVQPWLSPFVVTTLTFLLGILWQTWAPRSAPSGLLSLWCAFGSLVAAPLHRWRGSWLLLPALACTTGSHLTSLQQESIQRGQQEPPAGWRRHDVEIQGVIIRRLDGKSPHLRYRLYAEHWRLSSKTSWTPAQTSVRLLVRVKHNTPREHLLPGTRIRLRCTLRPPTWYANPGLTNWQQTLAYQGIHWLGQTQSHTLIRLKLPSRWTMSAQVHTLRGALRHWLRRALHDQQAGLLQALLLGDKSGLSRHTKDTFTQTGTAHLLAISGLHLALVGHLSYLFFAWLLSWSPILLRGGHHKRCAILGALPIVGLYTCISGASYATLRAFGMLLLLWGSIWSRRRAHPLQTLSLIVWVVLLWRPLALFSTSFQLSFLAVSVLLQLHHLQPLSPPTQSLYARILALCEVLWGWWRASCWATMATLPLALSFAPQLPLLGPFFNLFAIPLGGYGVVGTGLFAAGLWALWPGAGTHCLHIAGWLGQLLLSSLDHLASSTSFARPSLPPLRWFELGAYYCFLVALLWRRHRRTAICLMLTGGHLLFLGWSLPLVRQKLRWQRPPLTIHFFDVGQGDSMLLHFPNGTKMLLDAGGKAYGTFDIGKEVLTPTLRWHRVHRLDWVALSHPHPDHFGGLLAVFDDHPVGAFWSTGQAGHHPAFRKLRQKRAQKGIPQRLFLKPSTHQIGKVAVDILHPFPGPSEGKTYYWSLHANDNSLVMRLRYGKIKILLTGDLERRGEELLTQRWPDLRADVLKVPHHGSRTSSSERLLNSVRPQIAIFCLGRNNQFGFPHKEVWRRYRRRRIDTWRTDQHGQITLTTDGKTIRVRSFLSGQERHYIKK